MKTVWMVFMLWLGCHFLQAQSLKDSVSVTYEYKSGTKELIVKIHNGTSKMLILTQFSGTPIDFSTKIIINNRSRGLITSYGLCTLVNGKYQEPQKLYQIDPGERFELGNLLERVAANDDSLQIILYLSGFFEFDKISDLDENSYSYIKMFDIRY